MIDLVVPLVVQKLDDFLTQEGSSLKENGEAILSLRNSLERVMLYPTETAGEEKRQEVINLVYSVEDFIDKLILKTEQGARELKLTGGRGKCSIKESVPFLKAQLEDIHKKESMLGINYEEKKQRECLTDESFRDFNKHIDPLKSQLLSDVPDQCVIVIVGIAGSGKTTLSRRLFGMSFIHLRAWVHVSKDYEIHDILKETIKAFKLHRTREELDHMKTEELGLYLYESLAECSYLVVFDDLWGTEVWGQLRRAFPNNQKGSRVIITTRIRSITQIYGERTQVYELPFLDENKSLDFVCDAKPYVEPDCEIPCRKLGMKLVEKCKGLPIAVFLLKELFQRNLTLTHTWDWEKASNDSRSFWEILSNNSPKFSSMLDSSFDNLHHRLKLCYLYLGVFPDNFEIKVDKLVHLWVAEGFIQSGRGGTLEEVAMDYVNELADKNLIQIVKRNATWISACRVHPALKFLLTKKANKLKFFHSYDQDVKPVDPLIRRLASHNGLRKELPIEQSKTEKRDIRTLIFFSSESDAVAKLPKLCQWTTLTLLQVLDLEGTWFAASPETGKTTLPDTVGNLIHLRYLGLNDTFIDELPPSIKTLQALQTLYVDKEIRVSLPNEISNLKRLRHLFGRLRWPFEIENMKEIQTLGYIEGMDRSRFDFKNLVNIRELYIVFTKKVWWTTLDIDAIASLTTLQTLYIKVEVGYGWCRIDLQRFWKCEQLHQLKLKGSIRILPWGNEDMSPNLKYLYLDCQKMEAGFIQCLGKLPMLKILDLYGYDFCIYDEGYMVCPIGSFPNLETLQLIKCTVKGIRVFRDTMPLLKEWRVPTDFSVLPKIFKKRFDTLREPEHWAPPHDDDWPYYPRTILQGD